jgi:homospermidine synthase
MCTATTSPNTTQFGICFPLVSVSCRIWVTRHSKDTGLAATRGAAIADKLHDVGAVLSGVIWAMENPERWIVEPDEMDHDRVLEISAPYLGEMVGKFSDWTPLQDRERLFPEDVDHDDPWQFKNFRVV